MNATCLQCKICFEKKYLLQKFCSILCSNRHNLNNKINFKKPKKYSNELAELFGILLGDGSVTKYYVKIYLNVTADKGYSRNIVKLIKAVFPTAKPTLYIRENRGTEEIQISSTDISNYFRLIGFDPKKREIPTWITENTNFVKRTVRGLFDTEGSIGFKYFKGKNNLLIYKQLTFTNTNENIKKFVRKSLDQFGFSPTKGTKNNIYISNKKDIEKYFQIIGTSNPKLEKKRKIK